MSRALVKHVSQTAVTGAFFCVTTSPSCCASKAVVQLEQFSMSYVYRANLADTRLGARC